jgi:endonuclease/exonuclease/phosphatase family metal-dependent hydrolase
MKFRLVTYNIHKCIGGIDRRYRPERVVEVLEHYRPDVVLLQEVDDGVPRSRHHRQVDLLAEALAMPHRGYQRNVRMRVGHYGNATISRFPIRETVDIDLTMRFKKRRGALVTTLELPVDDHTRSVVVTNLHLGLAGFERRWQLQKLLADQAVVHHRRATPLIVAGDFNDVWSTLGRRIMQPAGFSTPSRHTRTFPAQLPLRPLDRVFYSGTIEATHSFAGHVQVARHASDHLPLVVDFVLHQE